MKLRRRETRKPHKVRVQPPHTTSCRRGGELVELVMYSPPPLGRVHPDWWRVMAMAACLYDNNHPMEV